VLGNDFYRIAHHDVFGTPRLHAKAIDLGCAAALLAELISTGHVIAVQGKLKIVERAAPPNWLAHAVLDQLIAEERRQHDIRTWLAFFAADATEDIARRLLRQGHVRREPVRRLGREVGVVYVPTDMNTAAMPWALMSHTLRNHQPLPYDQLCLAGLVQATGLDTYVLEGAPQADFEYLRRQVAQLPEPMRDLLFHTYAAVGAAVLAHRT
jgi:hypothetical protein